MSSYRTHLPQSDGGWFLTDAGCETDLIFNHGIEIREFASHTLLDDPVGRDALADYYRGFLRLAQQRDAGFVLDLPTWKAHPHWADDLGATPDELAQANRACAAFASGLREEFSDGSRPVVLNGLVGPIGDAYAPERPVTADEAEQYHAIQLGWLADTEADMVSALTFTQSAEAIGIVRAAQQVGLPSVISFTVETDGTLPTGESLGHAIEEVDAATDGAAAYFMVNCAHPEHFVGVLDGDWTQRIQGLRCNASRQSHAELDQAEQLDDGDPVEFGQGYRQLQQRLPNLNVVGGCCGSDLRHVTQVAQLLVG